MRYTLFTFLIVMSFSAFAQLGSSQGVCGTPDVNMDVLLEAKRIGKQMRTLNRRMDIKIPVRFKLIGETDGTNAANPNRVLDLMNAINTDFADYDFEFFLENTGDLPWDTYYNDALYSNHSAQTNLLRQLRSSNAVTIFVPEDANTGSNLGVTLGYFSPSLDILVFRKSEVGSDASTASHEIGHFFSLPHTFRGWDACAWDGLTSNGCGTPEYTSPVTQASSPGGNANELVTRGAGSNCATAGDTFCDTPADYNLGFGWNNCNYTGGVADANGDLLDPDENNFMGYFLNCTPYIFSDEQATAMLGNYNSSTRARLRGVTPDVTELIQGDIVWASPAMDGMTTQYYDEVLLDWDRLDNAQFYFLEVADSRSFSTRSIVFSEVITDASQVLLTDLEADEEYFYRLRPFSQIDFGQSGTTRSFTTGSRLSSTSNAPEAAKSISIAPNPLRTGGELRLNAELTEGTDVSITIQDLTGRILSSEQTFLQAGSNSLYLFQTAGLKSGSYTVSIISNKGVSTRKFLVD